MHGHETDVTLKLSSLSQHTPEPPSQIRDDYSEFRLNWSQIDKDLYFERVIVWWNKTKSLHDFYINDNAYMATLSFRADGYIAWGDYHWYWIALSLHNQSKIPDELVSPLPKEERFRPISKGRFYRAVIGRFLDTKAVQFSHLFPDYENLQNWQDDIAAIWSNHHLRTFRESLEVLDIFDFTLHLLSNLLNIDRIQELSNEHPGFLYQWFTAIERLQTVLTPFDILHLLARPLQIAESPYLVELIRQYNSLGQNEVENDVANKLELEQYENWELYRGLYWRVAVRGRCFSESFDEKRIAQDIQQFHLDDQYRWSDQIELRYWWQDLYVSNKHVENAALSVPVPRAWLNAEIFMLGEAR
jgi:hypothetical protein